MTARTHGRKVKDTYFELVERFPLVKIRTDAELHAAQQMLGDLLGRKLDRGEEDYLDVLVELVAAYESKRFSLKKYTPRELLEFLMAENGMTQRDLARETGVVNTTISAVLAGKRKLSLESAKRIARRFQLSVEAFIE